MAPQALYFANSAREGRARSHNGRRIQQEEKIYESVHRSQFRFRAKVGVHFVRS